MLLPKKKWNSTIEKKQLSLPKLIKKLDKIFSEYIRKRDSDSNGMCRCITCGKSFHWKAGDAGHFIQRDRIAVRWNEKNCNAQCMECNRFRSGNQFAHGKAIDKKFGAGTADTLEALGKARGAKIDPFWIERQIIFYKNKIKLLQIKCD